MTQPTNNSEQQSTLARLYSNRFDPAARIAKERLWATLVDHFLARFVPPDATVVDIAGGFGEFAGNVCAKRAIIVDLNPAIPAGVGTE